MARRGGIELVGLGRLRSATRRLASGMTEGADEGQRVTADLIADDWRQEVPVETGAYRDSIDSDDEAAFATAEHAPFVEFGTSDTRAQPAGTMAAEAGKRAMPGEVGDAVKRRLPR